MSGVQRCGEPGHVEINHNLSAELSAQLEVPVGSRLSVWRHTAEVSASTRPLAAEGENTQKRET